MYYDLTKQFKGFDFAVFYTHDKRLELQQATINALTNSTKSMEAIYNIMGYSI